MTAAQWEIPDQVRRGGESVPLGLFRESEGQHLRLVGDVDVRTVADLRVELFRGIDNGTGDLTLDCADLHLVDATGLGVLLEAHRRAQRVGRRLVLVNVRPELIRLLHIARLSRVLTVDRPAA
jgi:anti-anti-sigma factor